MPRCPIFSHVSLDLDLFPEQSRYRVSGQVSSWINSGDQPLDEILLTGGLHWEKLSWTMNGKPCSPIDRAHLFVFTRRAELSRRVRRSRSGLSMRDLIPEGISKRGGGSLGVHPSFSAWS